MRALGCGTAELYSSSGSQLEALAGLLTANAVAAGHICLDIAPVELLRAISGVTNVSAGLGWETAAQRMVDILLGGLTVR